jgi:hypothetical protein
VTCVAFVAVTAKVDVLPDAIVAGVAEMLTVGIAAEVLTVTVAVADAVPPGPVADAV